MLLTAIAFAAMAQGEPDPLTLPIGRPGKVMVRPGEMVETRSGRKATAQDVARAARGRRFVYLGESHDDPLHHRMQADIIRALVADGRDVVVGMEMFTRPAQQNLAGWTLGWYSDDEFIEKSDWKKQWGFDYSLYKPIFDTVKELKLPLVALNVPRDWVRAVGKAGFEGLSSDQKAELPAQMDLGNKEHREIFTTLMGGHPMTGAQGDNIYAAQVLWDEGMADTAVKYMATRSSEKLVMVAIAGAGHAMYEQGINWRVRKRTGDPGVTVVMGEAEGPKEVSRGLGEFVYLVEPKKEG